MSEKITLFDRFGGTRKMADALGEAPSTVQSWKTAGRIPAAHQPRVLAKAAELELPISAEDVIFPLADGPTPDHDASATKSVEQEVNSREPLPGLALAGTAEASPSGPFSSTCSTIPARSGSSPSSSSAPSAAPPASASSRSSCSGIRP